MCLAGAFKFRLSFQLCCSSRTSLAIFSTTSVHQYCVPMFAFYRSSTLSQIANWSAVSFSSASTFYPFFVQVGPPQSNIRWSRPKLSCFICSALLDPCDAKARQQSLPGSIFQRTFDTADGVNWRIFRR